MDKKLISLGEFIKQKSLYNTCSQNELNELLTAIRFAAKRVSLKVNQAALTGITGALGSENVQGEEQQKLDVIADEIFINTLINRDVICGIASEENEDFINIPGLHNDNSNKYVIMIDPLDGSSNIDVNVSVGTIFSIYKRVSPVGSPVTIDDFLQEGNKQVVAGYVIYGTSTMLVYTTGEGVNGFTLDSSLGTFFLSHPNMKIDVDGKIYSVNEGNYSEFSKGVQEYIDLCKDTLNKTAYSARYIGSLVADVHRNILKGGIYMYPETQSKPNGKLRLLYECNPFAMIIEQAGGSATDGTRRIMDIKPSELHQRVPFYAGSKNMVEKLKNLKNE
ncbi:class 1 fructose-bisphosphatase [Capnocytophaga sp. ARDL2]|uniref:class 1 fructose-bisphosphatase n=1 Tax=Capnocytophaga sp. ARDL2 TaxID=3238809 RepID=UPI0035567FB7